MKSWQYSAGTFTLIVELKNDYSVMIYSFYSGAVMMMGHSYGPVWLFYIMKALHFLRTSIKKQCIYTFTLHNMIHLFSARLLTGEQDSIARLAALCG